jgi:hypothetical protein
MRSGTAYLRRPWAPRTFATASSSSDGNENWPTPTTQDAKNDAGPAQHQRNSKPLNVHVAELPTGISRPLPEAKNGGNGLTGIPLLNPVFVETLMGFPENWTQIADGD